MSCNNETLNITMGTDVVLNDTLMFDGEVFDPNLSTGITANLVTRLGKRTALTTEIVDDELVIYVPWVEGRLPGYYGLEVTGTCNGQKWVTYADSLIRYTQATVEGSTSVTVESDSYDVTQVVAYRYSESPISSVTATIDDGVGTPSVTTTYQQMAISLAFHNLKGNGITSIEQTTTSTEDEGENVWTATMENGVTGALTVRNGSKGSQGIQGVQGASAVFDPETGNILATLENTTGDSTSNAMTQKAVTDELIRIDSYGYEAIDLSSLTRINRYLSGTWKSGDANNQCMFLPVTPGNVYKIEGSVYWHAFFMETNDTSGTPSYAGDISTMPSWSIGAAIMIAPTDANYLYIRRNTTDGNCTPVISESVTKQEHIEAMDASITELEAGVEELYNERLFDNIYSWESISTSSSALVYYYFNGSGAWTAGNSNNSCKFIPVISGITYKIENHEGQGYHHAFFVKTSSTDSTAPRLVDGLESVPLWEANTEYLTAPSDAAYLYVRVRSGGTLTTPQISLGVTIKDKISSLEDNAPEIENRIIQAAWAGVSPSVKPLRLVHYSDIHGDTTSANVLLNEITKYSSYIDNVISTGDVVHYYADGTTTYPQGYQWWQNCGLAEKSLFILGNHDGATPDATRYDNKEGTAAWDGKGKEWEYDNYFAPYKDLNEIKYVLPTGYDDSNSVYYKSCFWHKDFAEQKIRMIALDGLHRFDGIINPSTCFNPTDEDAWLDSTYTTDRTDIQQEGVKKLTAEQELWLVKRLKETLAGSGNAAEGYSVIFCGHYPLDEFTGNNMQWNETNHLFDCNTFGGRVMDWKTNDVTNWHTWPWHTFDLTGRYSYFNRTGTSTYGSTNNVANIIKAWMEDSAYTAGQYIAYIGGHYHGDYMFYPNNYPNMLVIGIAQAGWMRQNDNFDKTELNENRLTANYISVDTANGYIKMVRLGGKTDMWLTPINVLCYDYKNRKVIHEW